MTLQEIQDLAGHRDVPPWVVKLVGDAVAKEREACADIAYQISSNTTIHVLEKYSALEIAKSIRARRQA